MLPEEAIAAAAAEGLTLFPDDKSATGFWGVRKMGNKFVVHIRFRGEENPRYLGVFACAEEAALAVARAPGAAQAFAERAAREAKKRERDSLPSVSLDEVKRLADEERLTLSYDESSRTGYRGVYKSEEHRHKHAPFQAKILGRKAARNVGRFATAHEAALAIARELGPRKSADTAAAPARGLGGWVITAERVMDASEATRLAAEEGLALRRSRQRPRHFWNVRRDATVRADGTTPWIAFLLGPESRRVHLGTFACAEAGALAIARRLRDDAPLAAHVLASRATGQHSVVEVEAVAVTEVEAVAVDAWSDDEDAGAAVVVEAVAVAMQ